MRSLSWVLGYQLAVCLLYAVESAQLWSISAGGFMHAARQAFVILVAGGTLLGFAVAALEALRRAAEPRAPRLAAAGQVYALIALPAFYWLGTQLFSGAWISQQALAPVGPPLIALSGAAGLWITLHAIGRLASKAQILAAASLLLIASVLALLDRAFPKDSYEYAHGALMLFSVLALGAACRLLIHLAVATSPHRAVAGAVVAAALTCSLPLAYAYGPTVEHRVFWDYNPGYSGRLYEAARKAEFRYRSGKLDTGTYRDDVALWVSAQSGLPSPEESLDAWQQSSEGARRAAARIERPFPDAFRPHLVLITVDTLRADVAYEATGEGSIRRLDESALIFERVYSSSASTRQSLPVLLSGRADWRQHEDNLLGALQGAGYATIFVTDAKASQWLKTQDQLWLDQPRIITASGDADGWSSEQITQVAEKALVERAADAPMFLWVHYFDLHDWMHLDHAVRGGDLSTSYRRTWDRVQTQIARLVGSAQATLGKDQVCFVVASDHGEYLGEMNRRYHGKWVAPELVRVPLVLIVPGGTAAQVSDPVGIIDVAPTLALLAGVTLPGAEGIPLVWPNPAELATRPLAIGETHELGLVRGAHRLVLDPSRGITRLFDDVQTSVEVSKDAHGEVSSELMKLLLGSPVARR